MCNTHRTGVRIMVLALPLALVMAMVFMTACENTFSGSGVIPEDENGDEFAGGSGEEFYPYLIETAAQLNNLRNGLDKHYRMITDLDLSGFSDNEGWEPIGNNVAPLTGSLDGDGHGISNLKIDRPSNNYINLIGYVDSATIVAVILITIEVAGRRDLGGAWQAAIIAVKLIPVPQQEQ